MSRALLDGLLAGYGIAIPVGAIAILIVGVGMRCGFACGASAGAGAATADLMYATVAAVAGTAVAQALAPWSSAIRVVSAAVLVGLAVMGLARARRPAPLPDGQVLVRRGELALTYTRFLALTIINPLTVVYFTTMAVGSGAGRSRTPTEVAVFVAGAFVASLSWQLFLAATGAMARRGLSPSFQTRAAVAGNLLILVMAGRILL
jgi:arginine exporter protein ArgO